MSSPRLVHISLTITVDVDVDRWAESQEIPVAATPAAVRADVKSVMAYTARGAVEQLLNEGDGYFNFQWNATDPARGAR